MCNLFPYKNHHYRSKYPIVLLQERCEILQFKSGHPVCSYKNRGAKILFPATVSPSFKPAHMLKFTSPSATSDHEPTYGKMAMANQKTNQ